MSVLHECLAVIVTLALHNNLRSDTLIRTALLFFLAQDCFGYLGSFVLPYEVLDFFILAL
jgi:hypothetical protein